MAAFLAARSSIFGLMSMATTRRRGGKNLKSLPVPAATNRVSPRDFSKSLRLCGPRRRSSAKVKKSRVRLALSHFCCVAASIAVPPLSADFENRTAKGTTVDFDAGHDDGAKNCPDD